MGNGDERRDRVLERYSGLARAAVARSGPAAEKESGGGCGPASYADGDVLGVPESAVGSSLACGNPVAVAELAPGEVVLDLGCGGGLDVLLSAQRVGSSGRVYGLDASVDMLALARSHAEQAGVQNVEFLRGFLEDIPLPDGAVDAVISNCVLNLSTDKPRALAEAARVLRPGGRFGITDLLAAADLDPEQRAAAERQIACGVGVLTESEYRDQLLQAGFATVTITPTHAVADGLISAIVQARTPVAPKA